MSVPDIRDDKISVMPFLSVTSLQKQACSGRIMKENCAHFCHFSLCRNVNTQRGKTEDAFVCGHSSKICFIGGHGVPVGAIRPRMFLLLKGPQSYEYQCHILGKGR